MIFFGGEIIIIVIVISALQPRPGRINDLVRVAF